MTGRFTRPLFWLALALPALLMIADLARGAVLAMDLLHSSGEMSVRLMIAAFGYAALHLVFYAIDMSALAAIVDELTLPPIWTGWLALVLMIAPAAISFDAAMHALGRYKWKAIQRLVYAALLLSLAHWLLLDWKWQPAALHLGTLLAAWLVLLFIRFSKPNQTRRRAS